MKRTQDCPSEFRWDQWKLNKLSSSDTRALETHVQSCEWCQHQEQQRDHSLEFLLNSSVFDELMEEGLNSLSTPISAEETQPSFWSWLSGSWEWAMGPALLASVALVFLTRPLPLPEVSGVSPLPSRTAKGKLVQQWRVLHYRNGQKHSQVTRQGQALRAGDLLQFEYKLKKTLHIVIFSVNERNQMEAFLPMNGSTSLQLRPGQGTLPPNSSLELDENLGKERIVLLYSKKKFDWKHYQGRLQTLLSQRSLLDTSVSKHVFATELVTLKKVR